MKRQQNQQNGTSTGASAATPQNIVQEAQPLADTSNVTATTTQETTDSTAAEDGDQVYPQLAEETPKP